MKKYPLRLKWLDVADLADNPLNWREHPPEQTDALRGILDDVGWAGALLYNETTGRLIDGHLRKQVSKGPVPVLIGNWTEEQERKILATLDPVSTAAGVDKEKLGNLLGQIEMGSEAVQALLDRLADEHGLEPAGDPAEDPGAELDRAAELQEKWLVERGQVWVIGNHRLLCGDSTVQADVELVMNGAEPLIMVTDPPYSSGGRQDGNKRNTSSIGTRSSEEIARDNLTTRGYLALIGRVLTHSSVDVVYMFTDWRMWQWTFDALESSGLPVRNMLVWDKERMGMGFPWRNQHELIAFAKRSAGKLLSGKNGNVLRCGRTNNINHPTEKPAELLREVIKNNAPGDTYDPFLGSGTTMVAAEQLGRRCFGIEIEPKYCSVILERMSGMGCECHVESLEAVS